ncbi:MAG: hypothetical protein QME71_00325 [Dehalococcoidia bacterium]|nr:hypothetical protein [Dehalococcoidia bacterium]
MVLHLLLVRLKARDRHENGEALVSRFLRLQHACEVLRLGCVVGSRAGSTHDLALFAYLADAAALERFGTDARYMRFLQQSFLPAVGDFVTMDIVIDDGPLPENRPSALCFCLNVAPATYDWQVRSLLERFIAAPGASAASLGMALNDRQPYRAGGVVYAPKGQIEAFAEMFRELAAEAVVTGAVSVAGGLTLQATG